MKKHIFTSGQLERLERKERQSMYRDRAMERRLKFTHPDKILALEPILPADASNQTFNQQQHKSSHQTTAGQVNISAKPIGLDNKGATLLSKMGWRKGTGLGRNNEGITDIIRIESHVGTSGLGSKSHKLDPNLSYQEAVKKVMYQRYYEISAEENQETGDDEKRIDEF